MIWGYTASRTSTHSRTELMSQRRDAPRTWAGVPLLNPALRKQLARENPLG